MPRYVCVHGHFYQPPRENPGLEAIELQDSARPYHDWNERIKAECYAPNAAARILDDQGRITKIVNNYGRISFNFGPTLLTWLERNDAELYQRILAADVESQSAFGGHGSAMAQAYNHAILPLASRRDKETQIHWGVRDFEHRFGRSPEGMWLPETAVDIESLDLMAEHGVRFAVLAPHQAARVRAIGKAKWTDVPNASVDTRHAYQLMLPSGRSITLFFYNGPLARAIAFEGLLKDGRALVAALESGIDPKSDAPQLVHVATDGETFGHHHKYGDMALAYALEQFSANEQVRLTNYGEFLELHPPEWEVEIYERTAWSCSHGVGRWHTNCGCNSGSHPGFQQRWRTPLREALDFLRDQLLKLYTREASELFPNPEGTHLAYIDLILDRSPEHIQAFFEQHCGRTLSDSEQVAALRLLEIQRNAQLMYTSCGWFFDDVSGIETVQLLQYAGRALQLATAFTEDDLEEKFTSALASARSNLPEYGDARRLYNRFVKPGKVDLQRVAANVAITRVLDSERPCDRYCYDVECTEDHDREFGRARLAAGRIDVISQITRDRAKFSCIALHPGNHHAVCRVEPVLDEGSQQRILPDILEAFQRSDFVEAIRRLDADADGARVYGIQALFRDEQRAMLASLTESSLAETEVLYRRLFEDHTALMDYFGELDVPIPRPFRTAAEIVIETEIERALTCSPLDREGIAAQFRQAQDWSLELDLEALGYHLKLLIDSAAHHLKHQPHNPSVAERLLELTELLDSTPLQVDLWQAQNVFYGLLQGEYVGAAPGERGSEEGLTPDLLRRLGAQLNISVEAAH